MILLPRPLKKPTENLLHKFVTGLREYYQNPAKDPYDRDHLWATYQLYFNFLRIYADPRITQVTKIQWEAERIHIMEDESIDWRTRRGGKSIMLSRFAVFFSLIQFGKYEGQVIYRCPYADQLTQFKAWLRKNPFITKITIIPSAAQVMDSLAINMNNYGKSTSASAGGSVFLPDEGKKIPIDSALQEYYIEARGMFIEGHPREKRIIHASTGGDLTQFALDVQRLEKKQLELGRQLVVRIPWTLCKGWISQESIDEEMALNLDAPYYVDQEYNCINVPVSGYFFTQSNLKILGKDVPMDYFQTHRYYASTGGLDWNGSLVGHILYIGKWDGTNLYLMKELVFKTVEEVNEWISSHPEITVEVESKPNTGGFNAGYSDHLMSLGCPCQYIGWDEKGVKDSRLALLQRATIYAHPSCNWFIRNYKEATFDPKSLIPRLRKTSTQHGLDCGLHMINTESCLDTTNSLPSNNLATQNFNQFMSLRGYRG